VNSACGLGASVHGYGQLDLNMPCSRYSFVPQCCSVHASFFFFLSYSAVRDFYSAPTEDLEGTVVILGEESWIPGTQVMR